jgi:hypothetical protein
MKLVFYAVILLLASTCGQFVKFRGDHLDVLKNENGQKPDPADPTPEPADPGPKPERPTPQPIPEKEPDPEQPGNPGQNPTPNPGGPNECSEKDLIINRLNACIDCLYANPKWLCEELCCEEEK